MKLVLYFCLAILYLFSILPRSIINFLGNCLGSILFHLMKKRRKVSFVNLKLCFPEMTESEIYVFTKKHYQEFSKCILDYGLLFFADEKKLEKLVKVHNLEIANKYFANKSIIFMAPHFAGLDIGANRLSINYPAYSMYSPLKQPLFDRAIINARERFMVNRGGKIFPRSAGIKTIVKHMRQTKFPFYYLPDQDIGDKPRTFVPFFAHQFCPTIEALPKICKMTDSVIIPMMTKRDEKGIYHVYLYPELENYPSEDLTYDVTRMNQVIEKLVLDNPYQYYWLHKRFKTQPDLPTSHYYNQKI